MCIKILVLDNSPQQFGWIVDVVEKCLGSTGNYSLLPHGVNAERVFSLSIPQRAEPNDDLKRKAWADELLRDAGVVGNVTVDVAIVDLCLTDPPQLRDPEGLWVCEELRRRFPDCFVILASSRATVNHPSISGGWFRYVPAPPVRIDEVVGIQEDDPVSSRSQLTDALRKAIAVERGVAACG